MDNLDLSDFFITKGQAEEFSARLNSIIESIFTTSFNLEKSLNDQFGIQKKDKFINFLQANKIQTEDTGKLQEFLKNILQAISTYPLVSLTLAFEPSEEILKGVSQWFMFNLNKSAVFDIKVDEGIVGGATIMYNGRFENYSIKPKLDEALQEIILSQTPSISKPENTTKTSSTHQSTEFMTVGR